MESQPAIYISCAPEEFSTLLGKVRKDIERLAYRPISISHCPAGLDERKRLQWVDAQIRASVGVLHFPGTQFGSLIEIPDGASPANLPSPCSIHHYEILTALEKSKHTWVILPKKGCTHDRFPKEANDLKQAQRSFIYFLVAQGLLHDRADDDHHFNRLLTERYYEPEDLDHGLARKSSLSAKGNTTKIWSTWFVVATLLVLAIGVGLFHLISPPFIESSQTVAPTEKANSKTTPSPTPKDTPSLPLNDFRASPKTVSPTFTTIIYAISELQLQILAGEPPLSTWSDEHRESALTSLLDCSTAELNAALLQPRTTDIQCAQAFLIFNERERAEQEFDAIINSSHTQETTALAQLGKAIIAQDKGKHQYALECFQKNAANIDRATSPILWANAHHPIAFQLAVLRQFDESEKLLRQILESKTSNKPEAKRRLAGVKRTLTRVLLATDRAEEALPIMQEVLESDKKVLGVNHPWIALDHQLLASVLNSLAKYEEAESSYRAALSIAESHYGKSSPQLLTSLTSFAEFLHRRGKLSEAEPTYRRALLIHEKMSAKDSIAHASMLGNLASLLFSLQKYNEAAPLFQRTIQRFEELDASSSAPLAGILTNYSRLLDHQGQTVEATSTIRKAISITENTWGKNHPRVATSLLVLAQLLQQSQQNAEAEIHLRRALAIDINAYGEYHVNTARDLEHLVDFLIANSRAHQAEGLIRQALEIREIENGKKHQHFAANLDRLSVILAATNRRNEAVQYAGQALIIYATLRRGSEKFNRVFADVLNHYRKVAPQDTQDDDLTQIGKTAGWDEQEWKTLIAR